MKRIPKSFPLGGHTITVVRVSEEEMLKLTHGVECYGLFMPDRLTIYILKSRTIKASVLMQTFWHEYAHALLWALSHKDYTNETVVDQMGHALKQSHDGFTF